MDDTGDNCHEYQALKHAYFTHAASWTPSALSHLLVLVLDHDCRRVEKGRYWYSFALSVPEEGPLPKHEHKQFEKIGEMPTRVTKGDAY